MRLVSPVVYCFFFLASCCIGYWAMTPGLVSGINLSSPVGIASGSVLVFLASRMALWYASRKGAQLAMPSLGRGLPRRYLSDPLQWFLATTVIAFGFCVGSVVGYPSSGAYGQHVLVSHFSLFTALLLGQCLGYVLFRRSV
jgi:hypothetical protein